MVFTVEAMGQELGQELGQGLEQQEQGLVQGLKQQEQGQGLEGLGLGQGLGQQEQGQGLGSELSSYALQPSGRIAHSHQYIARVIQEVSRRGVMP